MLKKNSFLRGKGYARIVILIITLTVSNGLLYGQGTLKGVVTDGATKEGLIGAVVFDVSDKGHGVVTDINGNYQLSLKHGKDTVVCNMISMQPDTVIIQADSSKTYQHNFVLGSGSQQMQTLVVSAGKYERKLEEITVSMDVIKPSVIENKNASNITDVLEEVPGLDILDGEPQIRGGSGFNFGVGSRVAILVDGMPALGGNGGNLEWTFIPLENVEQVEVIKGASSVTYGSSALSGSINVRTAYAKDDPQTMISTSGGFYDKPSVGEKWWPGMAGFSNLSFMHAEKFGQLDLVFGGMIKYDHGYIGPPIWKGSSIGSKDTNSVNNNNVGEQTGRFNVNLRYRPKNNPKLNFGINGNVMKSDNSTTLIWQNDSSGIYRSYPNAMTLQHQTMLYVDPFINYNSSDGFIQSFRTRYSYTENDATNENQTTNATIPNILTLTNVIYSEYQVVKQINDGLNLTGGLIMNQTYSYNGIYFAGVMQTNHLQNFAGFVQVDKKLWKIVNLSLGFREESYKLNNDNAANKPVVRAGVNVKVTKSTYLRASFGEGYRYPSITEKYLYSNIGGEPVFPNPGLGPESSTNSEIGIKQEFKINGFVGALDVAAFQQIYNNTIEISFGVWDHNPPPGDGPVGFKYLNTGPTRINGIEVSLPGEGKITKDLKIEVIGDITYILPQALQPTTSYATDSNNSPVTFANSSTNPTNNILKYRFQTLGKIDIQLTYKKFSIGGDWRYYSVMQNIDTIFYIYSSVAGYDIEQYRNAHYKPIDVFDSRIGYQATKHFKIAFVVNNMFNLSYSLRPLKIESPRTFAIRLTYRVG